jgi:uncharacterized membrane protein
VIAGENVMGIVKIAASGFAAGAVLMYLADPDRGKRRRALVCDQSTRLWNQFSRLVDKAQRDAGNRTRGAACAVRAAFRSSRTDDDVLVQRIRSKLGRLVSHPHAIEVNSENSNIALAGHVLKSEAEHLVRCVRAVPGVRSVESKLEMHDSAEHISSLQGGTPREGRSELMQQNWTPALRVTAGVLGGTLLAHGLRNDRALATAGALAGAAMLGRAVFNREFKDIFGFGDGGRAVEFEKTIHIQAPVNEVYRYWSDYEKLPRFMTHLKEVHALGDGKIRWTAEGPGGTSISWEAETTQTVPNKLLAWRSVPGSRVETEGIVRFDENSHGGTRVSIRMCYKPPAGILGHYVAALFGCDPKSEIDDDMVRLKSLIEIGKTRAHGIRVDRESIIAGQQGVC